jgi:hypothetical protein
VEGNSSRQVMVLSFISKKSMQNNYIFIVPCHYLLHYSKEKLHNQRSYTAVNIHYDSDVKGNNVKEIILIM